MSTAGDVNGDGIDDLLIGASGADPNGSSSGASYVVFGGAGVGSSGHLELSALDGTNGFRLSGVAAGDSSGSAVSTAGDINGDGVDDLLIGAPGADPSGERSGASYVVFGGAGLGSGGNLDLSALDGTNGFRVSGAAAGDNSGLAVSTAGDVNRDRVDDLLIGALDADPNGDGSGASYVVFGQATPPPPPPFTCNGLPATIVGTNHSEIINGTLGPDVIVARGGNDVVFGLAGHDVICGGSGHDVLFGQGGHDKLFGQDGNDAMFGGAGNDSCDGGAGFDVAIGCQQKTGVP